MKPLITLRESCTFKKRLLSMAIASSLFTLIHFNSNAAPSASTQQEEQIIISIPAGLLKESLAQVASTFDIAILAPDALIKDKMAPAIDGSLNAEAAILQLLSNTDLTAIEAKDGNFVLSTRTATLQKIQTPPVDPDTESNLRDVDSVETIVVTGTRIERSAAQASAPVNIVTSDFVDNFGLNDPTEALRFIPSLNQSRSVLTSSDVFADNVIPNGLGFAGLNLRGLGIARTLVLVNGNRHVAGLEGQAAVDVSTIPAALIDRIEVLTGGGSSIYGADAVSGVVNYILKDDFEGVDYRAAYSDSTEGDAQSYSAAVTIGGNFDDDKGNAWISIDVSKQQALEASERDFFSTAQDPFQPNAAAAQSLGIDPRFRFTLLPIQTDFFSPAGNIDLFGIGAFGVTNLFGQGVRTQNGIPLFQIVDENGDFRAFESGSLIGGFSSSVGGDGFDNSFTLVPESTRVIFNGRSEYNITDQFTAFIEGKYSTNESEARIRDAGAVFVDVPIRLDNAFIPDALQSQISQLQAQGISVNPLISRDFGDASIRPRTEAERETFRIVGGIKGTELANTSIDYNVSVNYGSTTSKIIERNQLFIDRLLASLDAVIDPATGNPVCRSEIDPSAPFLTNAFFPPVVPGFATFAPGSGQCIPLNPFGADTVSDETAAFIATTTNDTFTIEQFVVNATFKGDTDNYFTLPGGAIDYVFGYEFREEKSLFRPDSAKVSQTIVNSVFSRGTIVEGEFDVSEVFFEVGLPILSNQALAEELSINASVRFADYSTAGSADSYAIGAVYSPMQDIRFRASFNRAVRAPNITELFTPQVANFSVTAFSEDPCDIIAIENGSEFRAANCAQFVPDLSGFNPGITPTIVISGGNTNLKEEIADTFTIGTVITPSLLPGLTIVADYYDISIEDAIGGGLDVRQVAAFCVDAPTTDNLFCDAVARDATTGLVQSIENTIFNLASLESQGIDYDVSYRFTLDEIIGTYTGDLTARLSGTYLMERIDAPIQNDPATEIDRKGTFLFPEHFINVGLDWRYGNWSVNYNGIFRENTLIPTLSNEQISNDPFFQATPDTGTSVVHNIAITYDMSKQISLFLRINDIADEGSFPFAQTTSVPTSEIGRQVQVGFRGML